MTEQSVVDAGQNFINADPVLGSIIVVLMIVIAALFLWIKAVLKEKDEKQLAHLDDVRKFTSEVVENRVVVAANTDQLRTNTETMKTMIEIFRERTRP